MSLTRVTRPPVNTSELTLLAFDNYDALRRAAIDDLLAPGEPDFDAFGDPPADHSIDVALADADNARARKPRRNP